MSHILVIVLVPPAEPDPAVRAKEMMWRYWGSDLSEVYDDSSEAKCDGFVIGGQYDGVIWGKEQHYSLTPDEFQARYGLDVLTDEDNIRPVSALVPVEEMRLGAIVTPDGTWHEREGNGTWDAVASSLLSEHRACVAVAFDCHS